MELGGSAHSRVILSTSPKRWPAPTHPNLLLKQSWSDPPMHRVPIARPQQQQQQQQRHAHFSASTTSAIQTPAQPSLPCSRTSIHTHAGPYNHTHFPFLLGSPATPLSLASLHLTCTSSRPSRLILSAFTSSYPLVSGSASFHSFGSSPSSSFTTASFISFRTLLISLSPSPFHTHDPTRFVHHLTAPHIHNLHSYLLCPLPSQSYPSITPTDVYLHNIKQCPLSLFVAGP